VRARARGLSDDGRFASKLLARTPLRCAGKHPWGVLGRPPNLEASYEAPYLAHLRLGRWCRGRHLDVNRRSTGLDPGPLARCRDGVRRCGREGAGWSGLTQESHHGPGSARRESSHRRWALHSGRPVHREPHAVAAQRQLGKGRGANRPRPALALVDVGPDPSDRGDRCCLRSRSRSGTHVARRQVVSRTPDTEARMKASTMSVGTAMVART
jgi:hypothetical protein